MNEDFLQYIWQYKLYYPDQLQTEDGQALEIIHPGLKNNDAGPDFFNAKIKLNGTLWAGNVEVHNSESEWALHGHDKDKSYDNVILHVVNNCTSETITSSGRKVPVWKIKYSNSIFERYQSLFFNELWIPCQNQISNIDHFIIDQWLDRLFVERMEIKSKQIELLLEHNKNDWDQVFFILLARSFGFGVNGQPFEMMAKQTPLKILLKHSDNLIQLEALLLGQAGLLDNPTHSDAYTESLQKEYRFLSNKYQLTNIESHLWKFLRLRPTNFPTIRIAQLVALIHLSKGLFSNLQNLENHKNRKLNLSIHASDYWDTHFVLGKQSSKNSKKHLGSSSKQLIVYNTIYPYLFVYHDKHNNKSEKENILEQLYKKTPEKNRILSNWKKSGIVINNEAQAQSLIFLKNHYCNHKKCLNCHIGHKVLSKA